MRIDSREQTIDTRVVQVWLASAAAQEEDAEDMETEGEMKTS